MQQSGIAVQSDALGPNSEIRWFSCPMPALPEDWDWKTNQGFCRTTGDSTAANQKTGTPGATREDRRWLQTALKSEGFDPGPADGQFGPKTQAAIKAWQRSIGQAATGQLTDSQMRRLLPQRWKDAQQTKPAQQAKATAGGGWKAPAPTTAVEPQTTEAPAETEAAAIAALSPKCAELTINQLNEPVRDGADSARWCWHNLDEQQGCYVSVLRWKIEHNRERTTVPPFRWSWTGDCRGGKLIRGTLTTSIGDEGKSQGGPIADGLRNGHWVHWYKAGVKDEEGSYVDNKRDGRWTNYYTSGTFANYECYRAGKEIVCN